MRQSLLANGRYSHSSTQEKVVRLGYGCHLHFVHTAHYWYVQRLSRHLHGEGHGPRCSGGWSCRVLCNLCGGSCVRAADNSNIPVIKVLRLRTRGAFAFFYPMHMLEFTYGCSCWAIPLY